MLASAAAALMLLPVAPVTAMCCAIVTMVQDKLTVRQCGEDGVVDEAADFKGHRDVVLPCQVSPRP
jgi:hypothetical protein